MPEWHETGTCRSVPESDACAPSLSSVLTHVVAKPWLFCLVQLAFPMVFLQHRGTFRKACVPHWGIKVEFFRCLMVDLQYRVVHRSNVHLRYKLVQPHILFIVFQFHVMIFAKLQLYLPGHLRTILHCSTPCMCNINKSIPKWIHF